MTTDNASRNNAAFSDFGFVLILLFEPVFKTGDECASSVGMRPPHCSSPVVGFARDVKTKLLKQILGIQRDDAQAEEKKLFDASLRFNAFILLQNRENSALQCTWRIVKSE